MKILFTVGSLTGGGAERVCAVVAGALAQRGHHVTILTLHSQQQAYEVSSQVHVITQSMGRGPITKLSWRFRFLIYLLRFLKREQPDAVVSILGFLAWQAKLAALLTCRCAVIFSDHNAYERPKGIKLSHGNRWNKFYLPFFLDGNTVLAERDKEVLAGRYRNTAVMPNPLFLEPLNQVPKKEPIVLAVGRMDAWHVKGFDLLLKAWQRVEARHADWRLRIVGAALPKTLATLRTFAGKAQRVEFVPFTQNVAEEYQRAAVFVLSSRYEGFGMVLTEAMSQGCASIACDYWGRQADIVHSDGLLIPVTNEQCEVSLVTALSTNLDILMTDASLRHHFQQQALLVGERYRPEHIAAQWEHYLQDTIAKHTSKL